MSARVEVWRAFPKQREALQADQFEILFGGSRGGGKTDAGLVWLLGNDFVEETGKLLIHNPRYRALILRKSYEDLSDWLDRAGRMFRGFKVEIVGKPATIRFPSGAMFKIGHLKDRKSYEKYLGHEYQRILIEELTLIPQERYYIEIMGSCRSTVDGIKPQMFATTNPGSVGHSWVKKRFVTAAPWGEVFIGENNRSRVFIPANIDDNPVLQEKDPGYVQYLEGLKKVDLALWKAWRLGDWDSFVGQAFSEWEHSKHVTRRFDVPTTQFKYKIISFDWGYSDPGVAVWIGITPENQFGVARAYVYREIHQNKTNPNQWAKDIEKFTLKEPVKYMVLPHDCFSTNLDMHTIAETFGTIRNGASRLRIERGRTLDRGARLNRKAVLHSYLADARDGRPWLQIYVNCLNAIRTIPELVLDDANPEDVNTDGDDHDYDAISLGLMTIGLQPGQSGGVSFKSIKATPALKQVGENEFKPKDFWEEIKQPVRPKRNPEFN